MLGRASYREDVRELGGERRVIGALEGPDAVRLPPVACQTRCPERREIPAVLAIARPVHWVASPGGSVIVTTNLAFGEWPTVRPWGRTG